MGVGLRRASSMDLWLFIAAVSIAILMVVAWLRLNRWHSQANVPNPFETDCRQGRKPYIHDQKERDAVIKQGFAASKIPENLDAVVVGSGIGGASEIAFNIIPVIEKAGGKVLVRANVREILFKGGKTIGVRLGRDGKDPVDIMAPIVISNAGLYNTFQKLLHPMVASRSYYHKICTSLKPGNAAMNVFLGLSKNAEEPGLRKQSTWAFTDNKIMSDVDSYFEQSATEAMDRDVPLLFISFPFSKDPEWSNHPGRKDKATCAIVTLANWEWFKEWDSKPVKKRGDDYDEVKNSIGHRMIEQTCQLFPQLKDCIDFVDIGSPVTNSHYIAQPHGEIYGLDHSSERFDPLTVAQLRPKTDIEGLFLTGQDILSCGFTGALWGGLLCAQQVLGRNIMTDLTKLNKKIRAQEKKE